MRIGDGPKVPKLAEPALPKVMVPGPIELPKGLDSQVGFDGAAQPMAPVTVVAQQPVAPDSARSMQEGKALFLPLAKLVETGAKAGAKPAERATLVDEKPLELGVNLGTLFKGLTASLSPENKRAEVRESAQTLLVQTAGLTTVASALTQALKPVPPAIVAKVAELIRSGNGQRQVSSGEVTQLESTVKGNFAGLDLSACDVETLATIVMFQASSDATLDLRELLKDVDSTRRAKDGLRKHIQEMKEMQSRTNTQLRGEYDRRRELPEGDPSRIEASMTFEQFKNAQQLDLPVAPDGGLDVNGTVYLYPQDAPSTRLVNLGGGPNPFDDPFFNPSIEGGGGSGVSDPWGPGGHPPGGGGGGGGGGHGPKPILDVGQIHDMVLSPEGGPAQPTPPAPTGGSGGSGGSTPETTYGVRGMMGSFADLELLIGAQRDKMDSMNELGESQTLQMQMRMDRLAGLHSLLSNMMKKWSDTSGAIVANFK